VIRRVAFVCLCALLVGGLQNPAHARAPQSTAVKLWKIEYRSHDGRSRNAWVALPSWYGPKRDPALPLVISPHGRGVNGLANSRLWGRLPALDRFAVVSPDGQGRRLPLYSWGYGGQIADLARMPQIVQRALPWLRIAPDRIYAVGASMGGQEALLLTAEYPSLLKGTAVFDAPTDLALQYRLFLRLRCGAVCRRQWKEPIGLGLQRLARLEVGGSPSQVPAAYAERSPVHDLGELARAGVPLGLWWSVRDRLVPAGRQEAFLDALVARSPHLRTNHVVGAWPHVLAMRLNLPAALRWLGLAPR
jgi:pimeloyl-ACP methyl ester carboxylesterase